MTENNLWSLNFSLLFENYKNVREWCGNGAVFGVLIGDFQTQRIANVIFDCSKSFNIAYESVQFVVNSFASDLELIGVLMLADCDYKFDVTKLNAVSSNETDFLVLETDTNILGSCDIESFLQQNSSVRRSERESMSEREGLLARVSQRICLNIRLDNPKRVSTEMSKAFALEAEAVENLCFINTDRSVLLSDSNQSDISPLFDGLKRPCIDKNQIEFESLREVSGLSADDDTTQKLVPIVKIRNGPMKYYQLKMSINGYTVIKTKDSAETVLEQLRNSLRRSLYLTQKCIDHSSFILQNFVGVRSYAFFCGNSIINVCYPLSSDENLLADCRKRLHRVFNLPLHRPFLRPSQSVSFGGVSRLLRDPHLYITNYKPKGELSLVQGHYDYHHYMQDGIDDSGWGCAYRSFQSIWSWLILQGYTDKPVPTHRQIQQALYEIGDKDEKFVGSRQWIGSMELGFCLENMLGMQSRIISTNSGAEVADNVRQLAQHFNNFGAPVMIGGGMLAHTILGVDFNDSTGDCAFLVLDPHYTGDENITTVVSKGWCAWKTPEFWSKDSFYNLLLPITPSEVV